MGRRRMNGIVYSFTRCKALILGEERLDIVWFRYCKLPIMHFHFLHWKVEVLPMVQLTKTKHPGFSVLCS